MRGPVDAEDLKERGREIDETDQVGDPPPRSRDPAGPVHDERNSIRVVVGVPFHAGERHAVVRGDDDERVRRLAAGLQRGQQRADLSVEGFDLDCVIKHVAAHRVIVRPIRGHAINVGGFLASRDARVRFVTPMRILAAEPIEERLAGRAGFKKSGQASAWIAAVVSPTRAQGESPRAAIGQFRFARPPRLASGPAGDARLGDGLTESHELRREIGLMIRCCFELPGIASREDGGTGRGALGRRCVGVVKDQALLCQPINVRRLHPGATIDTGVAI